MEQKKQRRKLGFAILISLVLHLAVGYSLAAFGNVFTPTLPPDEVPPELTIMDLSEAPAAQKNPQFIETEKAKESAEKPKEQTFESNANSLAASQLPATGDLPLPSQDGKDLPVPNFRRTIFFAHPGTGSAAAINSAARIEAVSRPRQSPLPPRPRPRSRNNWRC